MAITKIHPIKSTLKKAIDYIVDPAKTDDKLLVSSFGCAVETADLEFEKTRLLAMQKGNNLAHQLIQAFEPGEVSYAQAHEIGRQLADEILGGKYEYVIATHINKEHCHIVGLFKLSREQGYIVRPIPDSNDYEILAGHNRTRAWQMTGHDMIPAEVVSADDARAVSIAVATNLLRRQDLTIIERGKAYKAVLDAEKRQGARTDIGTSGENRQKFLTREIVADFFGVTEYEIRKAIKLAGLIEPLADILEDTPRKLPIACAELIADYDATTQQAFVEMCSIEGYTLNKATVQKITRTCPPPSAGKQEIYAVWRQARAEEAQRRTAPPKKISFDRRKFAPYLQKLGKDEFSFYYVGELCVFWIRLITRKGDYNMYLNAYTKEENYQKYFDFLEKLRQSGETNMYGAVPYLQSEFPELRGSQKKANAILIALIKSFEMKEGDEPC